MTAVPPAAVPSPRDRLVRALGRLRRRTLRRLEFLAYDVIGMPMAVAALRRGFRPAGDGDAAFLHAWYGRVYWRLPAGIFRLLAAIVVWPFVQLVLTTAMTRRNGAAMRQRAGRPAGRQVRDQLVLAAECSIAPLWYYMFELYDDAQRARAPLFLTAHETIAGAYETLQPPPGSDDLNDKVWFARHCRAHGIAAVPVLLLLAGGRILPVLDGAADLPEADLFVKPRVGNGGRNTERWDWRGGRYHSSRGLALAPEALRAQLALQSLKGDFVVQPRLVNHPELVDIANDALSTVRVLTCRDEAGGCEATNAALRMAIGSNNRVDNFHSGGIAAAVDLATGRLGRATDMGVRPAVGWRESHPVSGAPFVGRRLPFWPQVLDLACRTHAIFPERTVVGWDVAMLPDGPIIIEGNGRPDLDIHQRVERRPLGDQRIAALLRLHLGRRAAATARQRR